MRKFKLIKNFPDSGLDLGDVITFPEDSNIAEYKAKNSSDFLQFTLSEVEKYTEYWLELIDISNDFTVLSIKYHGNIYELTNTKIANVFVNSQDFKYEYKGGWMPLFESIQDSRKVHPEVEIHSVKRLSDDKVFTVGDTINVADTRIKGKIDRIIICNNPDSDVVASMSKNSKGKLFFCVMNHNGNVRLDEANILKKPLFTTEDGVDIYEGDKYCWVRKDPMYISDGMYTAVEHDKKDYLYFSTREAAKEYVLLNKLCLSINDIKECFKKEMLFVQPGLLERFIDKVKEKCK